jgi:hypothetical protein
VDDKSEVRQAANLQVWPADPPGHGGTLLQVRLRFVHP